MLSQQVCSQELAGEAGGQEGAIIIISRFENLHVTKRHAAHGKAMGLGACSP